MITLPTTGTKIPENGDTGRPVFEAMESNFRLFDGHTHDGANSSKINSMSIDKPFTDLSSGSWTLVAGGRGYEQTVTCPGSITLDKVTLRFRIRTGANINKFIHPTVVPSSLTVFKVIQNDPSLNLEVLYI